MATTNKKQAFGFLAAGLLGGAALTGAYAAANDTKQTEMTTCGFTVLLPQTKEAFDAMASLSPPALKKLQDKATKDNAVETRGFALQGAVETALKDGKAVTVTKLDKAQNCFDYKVG